MMPRLFTLTTILFLAAFVSLSAQEVAFTLPEKDLIPECIAWSAKQKAFYLTSIHKSKIVRYDPVLKSYTDFIVTGQEGVKGGIGLIVDEKRNILWSCSGMSDEKTHHTGVFAWDLASGKLLHKYIIEDTLPILFNDLALDKKGGVYFTDLMRSRIMYFNTSMQEPKVFLSDIEYPNGIAMGPKQRLFVASHLKGITRIDIKSKKVTELEAGKEKKSSTGIDGLKYHKGRLYAVRNGLRDYKEHGLWKYTLSKKQDAIAETVAIDKGNPHFIAPTTGVIMDDVYYLIANSCLNYLDQKNNTIPDPEKLVAPTILKYQL